MGFALACYFSNAQTWFQLTCQLTAVTWLCTCETYRRTAWLSPAQTTGLQNHELLIPGCYHHLERTGTNYVLRGNVSDLWDSAGSQAKDSSIKAVSSWEGWGRRRRKQSEYPSNLKQVNFEVQPLALWFPESPFTKTSLKDRGKNKKKIIVGERVNMKVRDGVYHSFIHHSFKKYILIECLECAGLWTIYSGVE